MTQKDVERLCKTLLLGKTGKRTRTDLYVHRTVAETACPVDVVRLDELWAGAAGDLSRWNVLRIATDSSTISLLLYPGFYDVGHPVLHASLRVNKHGEPARLLDFRSRKNRPILHRKELLVPETDDWFRLFRRLSAQETEWGLLDSGRSIGYEKAWSSVLQSFGAAIDGHRVVKTTQ